VGFYVTVQSEAVREAPSRLSFVQRFSSTILQATQRREPWSRLEYLGFTSLIFLWLAALIATWGNWGYLTIDCGREIYVPTVLLKHKVLYRDIWYLYGPAAPYFNALLFKIFGIRLTVLYLAGAFSALGSILFLYLAGAESFFTTNRRSVCSDGKTAGMRLSGNVNQTALRRGPRQGFLCSD
jgi:hypothetical protein